jgi:hypothetical protein
MKITELELAKKLFSSSKISDLTKVEKKESLNTGISYIDNDFGFPTGYYIVIGNQGVGKSWFALWLARMFYQHDVVRSVYFSLEMPRQYVVQRILQQWSDITKSDLESGKNTDAATAQLANDTIVVDEFYSQDTKHQTVENFALWVDEYYQIGYRVFLLDHFHELGGASVNETNQKAVANWGLAFQQVCKKYPDIWMIVFAQPNATDFNKKILTRNSLRGSKSLIDKCDYVLTLNRNFERDEETEALVFDESNPTVLIYLDKTRYTEKPNIIFKLRFLSSGNFTATGGAE